MIGGNTQWFWGGTRSYTHTHTEKDQALFSLCKGGRLLLNNGFEITTRLDWLVLACVCLSVSLSLLWSLSLSLVATCNNKMVFLFWCVVFVTECAASSVEITNWLVPFRAGKNGWERISKPFQYRKKSGTLLQ